MTRIPYPIGIRTVTVGRRELVTPRMLRLTLTGPGLDGFHSYVFDDHVRIVFPDPDGTCRLPVPNDRRGRLRVPDRERLARLDRGQVLPQLGVEHVLDGLVGRAVGLHRVGDRVGLAEALGQLLDRGVLRDVLAAAALRKLW
ncbi:siderophore-interacting protein [Nonomuraea rubra]|uniref:siderophore-interacting protein n=1 Tax=Nonomuraea rubra TaxID=46180 RepID=UPI00340B1683